MRWNANAVSGTADSDIVVAAARGCVVPHSARRHQERAAGTQGAQTGNDVRGRNEDAVARPQCVLAEGDLAFSAGRPRPPSGREPD